ncbi:hypothetical protein ACPPVT_08370 [Angustibacter sp. McL0619]|uniref:hypothetical protein n=1 Tax=Angustibacter sp. McL0619 TaxID=3415676 RepID=UPI003CFA9813
MPADQRPVGGVHLTRRQLVRAGLSAPALCVLPGCSLRIGEPDADPTMPAAGGDELARERVALQSDQLAASAMRAASLRPDAARQLAVIVQQHREHAAALRPVQPSASSGTTASSGLPTDTDPSGATAATALTKQAAAERAGASAIEPELARVSGDVARLLASVAACRTVHAATLQLLPAGNKP